MSAHAPGWVALLLVRGATPDEVDDVTRMLESMGRPLNTAHMIRDVDACINEVRIRNREPLPPPPREVRR